MRDDRIFIFVLKIPRSSLYFACTIFFLFSSFTRPSAVGKPWVRVAWKSTNLRTHWQACSSALLLTLPETDFTCETKWKENAWRLLFRFLLQRRARAEGEFPYLAARFSMWSWPWHSLWLGYTNLLTRVFFHASATFYVESNDFVLRSSSYSCRERKGIFVAIKLQI